VWGGEGSRWAASPATSASSRRCSATSIIFRCPTIRASPPSPPASQIELFHGYTYTAHPLACAAAIAAIEVYEQEDLFGRVRKLAPLWAQSAHSLKGARHVSDVRSIGLLAGIDLQPREGAAGARGAEAGRRCFEAGMLVRNSGDTLLLSPPLVIDEEQIAHVFATIQGVLAATP
jgi:beta-alanine--pyruvate transaminase